MFGKKGIAIAVVFLMAMGMVFAEMLPDGGVTIDDLVRVLVEKGYEYKITGDDASGKRILAYYDGTPFLIFFGTAKNGRSSNYQFVTVFDLRNGVTMDQVYKWNSEYRFARMYKDNEDDPIFEMDVDCEHGWTYEALDNAFERWFAVVKGAKKYVGL